MKPDWESKLAAYCETYNIPLEYLSDTLNEPKVIPMIRGKAFEFSVMDALKNALNENDWKISHPTINAQTGLQDVDVQVFHKASKKIIRVECKLAKKEGFIKLDNNDSQISVKCMRSRTLGTRKVRELAPKLGVSRSVLSIHNDQYLPADFDVVVISIGNAFYRTNKNSGTFFWSPTKEEVEFLNSLKGSNENGLKDFAFNSMFVARTIDLIISKRNGVKCTRSKCKNKSNCGFVPNYPKISFDKNATVTNNWIHISQSAKLFESFL